MNATRDTAAQRVSATPPPLAPEEISATEWFYMGSMACSFAAGAGFPGRVLAERSFIWHCGPVGAGGSSRVFTREHLAQTAQIQTIVCIPAPDGVIEFGTTALVEKDVQLLQQLQSVFQDNSGSGSARTRRSAFKRWSPTDPMAVLRSSPKFQQHLLKAALFTVPRAHATKKEEVQIQYSNEAETSAQLYSGMRSFRGGPYSSGGSSISAHARNERNRRQKLHDRFMTLRSLVPNITKPDKVSLLGDAVLYVQDLHRRVTELEASKAPTPKTPTEPRVEVTIEKNTAYLKLSSPWQDGLIIHILERLHDFHLEVVDVSARVSHDAVLNAQLKAKVMSSTDGDDNDDDEEEVAKTASTIEATLLSTIANVMSSAR